MSRKTLLAAALIAGLSLVGPAAAASTLEQIKSSNTIRLGYRENSIPFSFVGEDSRTVIHCRPVQDRRQYVAKQLNIESSTLNGCR